MKTYLNYLLLLTIVCCLSACDDDAPTTDCELKAFYKGTAVCSDSTTAAAIELDDDSPSPAYLIVNNFFELIDGPLEFDDVIYITYDQVDSTLFNSGALCGALIVAPITEGTCLSLAD